MLYIHGIHTLWFLLWFLLVILCGFNRFHGQDKLGLYKFLVFALFS